MQFDEQLQSSESTAGREVAGFKSNAATQQGMQVGELAALSQSSQRTGMFGQTYGESQALTTATEGPGLGAKILAGLGLAGDAAIAFGEILVAGGLSIFTGAADFTIAIGRIWKHIAPFVDLPCTINPSAMVHVHFVGKTGMLTLSAKTLSAPSLNLSNLQSGAVALSNISITVNGKTNVGAFALGGLHATAPQFTTTTGPIAAAAMDLTGVSGAGASGAITSGALAMEAVRVRGLVYPGVPPVDVALNNINASFATLPSVVAGSRGGTSATPKVKFPVGATLQVTVEDFTAAALVGSSVRAAGGLGHAAIRLMQGGTELAAVEIHKFVGGAAGAAAAGSIEALEMRGEGNFINSMISSPEVQAQPDVKRAMDLVKMLGIKPVVSGVLRMSHLSYTGTGKTQTAQGNLHAEFRDAAIGNLTVDLTGFHGDAKAGGMNASFTKFAANLVGSEGSVGLEVNAPQANQISTDARGTISAAPMAFEFTGKAEHADRLLKALTRGVATMPPQVKAAFELVKSIGATAKGTISAEVERDGTTKVTSNFRTEIAVPGLGRLVINAVGLSGSNKGGFGGSVDHFDATLTDRNNREAAFLAVDGPTSNAPHAMNSFVARGTPTTLLSSLEQHAHALPPAVMDVLRMVRNFGLGGSASGTFEAHTVGKKLIAHGNIRTHIAAAYGEVDLAVDELTGDLSSGPLDVSFARFSATLKTANRRDAANITITGQTGKDSAPGDGRATQIHAQRIQISGDADRIRELLTAIGTQVGGLPPVMRNVIDFVQGQVMDAGGTLTMSNVDLTEDRGKLRASTDVNVVFRVGELGTADVKVSRVKGTAQASQLVNGQFEQLQASLKNDAGAIIANVKVKGLSNASGNAKGDIAFNVSSIEVSGSAIGKNGLIEGINAKLTTMPEGLRSALQAARGIETDLSGSATLTDGTFKKVGNQVSASGNLAARLNLDGAGSIDVSLLGFATTVDTANASAAGSQFREFKAELYPQTRTPGKPAAKISVNGLEQMPTSGAQGDFAFRAKQVHAEGDGGQVELLMQQLQQHVTNLPEPMRNAFETLRSYGLSGVASLDLSNATVQRTDGKLTVGGGVGATINVPNIGRLTANLDKFQAASDGSVVSFDNFAVSLKDVDGKNELASLSVAGASLGTDAKAPAHFGAINVRGDGRKLGAALHAAGITGMPKPVVDAISMIGKTNLAIDAGDISLAAAKVGGGYVVHSPHLHFSTDLDIVDKAGNVYEGANIGLDAENPQVMLDASYKLKEIHAGKLTARGEFARMRPGGQVQRVNATVTFGSAHVKADANGNPSSVEATDIAINATPLAGGAVNADAMAQGQVAAAKAAQTTASAEANPEGPSTMERLAEAAPLLRDAELHTSTPVFAGHYGQRSSFFSPSLRVGVHPGSKVTLDAVIKDGAIDVSRTKAKFTPAIDAPAWLKGSGAYLKRDGSTFDIEIDVRGFFDISVGPKGLALDVTKMMEQLAQRQRSAIEAAEAQRGKPEAAPSEREAKVAAEFAEDRQEWQAEVAAHQADAQARGEEVDARTRAKDAFAEPRSSSIGGIMTPGVGLDLVNTVGNARIALAGSPTQDTAIAGGSIIVPKGAHTTLTGTSAGGGPLTLTADRVDALAITNPVTRQGSLVHAEGVQVSTNTNTEFASVAIKRMLWNGVATADKATAEPDVPNGQKDPK